MGSRPYEDGLDIKVKGRGKVCVVKEANPIRYGRIAAP